MPNTRGPLNWLMLGALVVFWGSSFALTKIAVDDLSPVWVMALRLAIGAFVLYAMMWWQGVKLQTGRQAFKWYVWLGLIGSVLPFLSISWSTQYIPSGLVGILMALVPLVTLVLSRLLLPDEKLGIARILGFLIGFAGLVILLGPQTLLQMDFSGHTLLAEGAVMLAATAYALQVVTARKTPEMPPLVKSTGVVTAAAISGLLLASVFDPGGIAHPSIGSTLAVAALGVFPTALAAVFLFGLIDRAGPSFVVLSNYLIPPFAYTIGIVTLAEPFELRAVFGLAVILCGIYIAERK